MCNKMKNTRGKMSNRGSRRLVGKAVDIRGPAHD